MKRTPNVLYRQKQRCAESTAGVIPHDVGAAITAVLDTVKLEYGHSWYF